jgi:hypothetical protein
MKHARGAPEQHARSSAESQSDRDRTLDAMHALETAVGRAASRQADGWKLGVDAALEQLEGALAEQRASYHDPTSLMAQIAQDDPRLRTFVRQLHHRFDELSGAARALREQLARERSLDAWTIADVRDHTRWLMTALHHHRAREADLVFDALEIDLGTHRSHPDGRRAHAGLSGRRALTPDEGDEERMSAGDDGVPAAPGRIHVPGLGVEAERG